METCIKAAIDIAVVAVVLMKIYHSDDRQPILVKNINDAIHLANYRLNFVTIFAFPLYLEHAHWQHQLQ